MPTGMDTVSATAATTIPATLDPYGMRSKIATKAPSSNGYGTSKMTHQPKVAAPAMIEVATLPST